MQVLLVVWMVFVGVKDVAVERGLDVLRAASVGVGDIISAEGPIGPPPPRP